MPMQGNRRPAEQKAYAEKRVARLSARIDRYRAQLARNGNRPLLDDPKGVDLVHRIKLDEQSRARWQRELAQLSSAGGGI